MTDKVLLRGAARKVFDLITNFFLWSLQSKSRGLEWVKKSQGDADRSTGRLVWHIERWEWFIVSYRRGWIPEKHSGTCISWLGRDQGYRWKHNEWEDAWRSVLLLVLKSKGDVQHCSNYRGTRWCDAHGAAELELERLWWCQESKCGAAWGRQEKRSMWGWCRSSTGIATQWWSVQLLDYTSICFEPLRWGHAGVWCLQTAEKRNQSH